MASARTHRLAGAGASITYAALQAGNQEPWLRLLELLGAGAGGAFGAQLPDALEPAVGWNHRRTAHSAIAGAVLLGCTPYMETQAQRFRLLAAREARAAQNPWLPERERTGALIRAAFYAFSAGVANGSIAGYCSHLALDSVTPAGLPVV